MRIFRKSSAFSKLADEEEPLRLLHHNNSGSELGIGKSEDRNDEDDTDEKYNGGDDRPRPRCDRYQRIGQLPAGFMSISALVRDSGHQETVAAAATTDEAHELDEHPSYSQADEFRNDFKRSLYLLMEQPSSSAAAFWTNVIVSVLIVSSAVMTTIETIPAFRSAESNRVWYASNQDLNRNRYSLCNLELESGLIWNRQWWRCLVWNTCFECSLIQTLFKCFCGFSYVKMEQYYFRSCIGL